MDEYQGWLLDVYPALEGGLSLWLLVDDQPTRLHLTLDFPITFYAAGPFALLRQAWQFLQPQGVQLARLRRCDLFSGERDVLAVTVAHPIALRKVFAKLAARFTTLDYYNADIPFSLHFIARTGVHLLGRCRVLAKNRQVLTIEAQESPWTLDPLPLPLRVLTLRPDTDPTYHPPQQVQVAYEQVAFQLPLLPQRAFMVGLRAVLQRYDPDLLLTDYGDTWLLPHLNDWGERVGVVVNPSRDTSRGLLTRRAKSYFAYGQVIFRGQQAHLFGRWHIDRQNALLFDEYDLAGVLEQVRVSGVGVQEMARKSPGAGITAMQMLTALRTEVLVPVVKQQAESPKSLSALIQADRGGMIYQPTLGVHRNVAQIDFTSMYPTIIVGHNISPENPQVGHGLPPPTDHPTGLIPQALKPLLEKRLAMKQLLTELSPNDCRYKPLKARAAALKWLLVVCFGYLGYKNARFGKIEAHEAVTALSRELLLQAKEVAEAQGFEVLHMYVDSLFVQKSGCNHPADFAPLLAAIQVQTRIAIALEGVYRWVAFLPSKANPKVPVPNRYFGAFQNGSFKYRGIEARRRDTSKWVRETQLAVLACLAQAPSLAALPQQLPKVQALVQQAKRHLRAGRVPQAHLVVMQKLSRLPKDYASPSAAARAALQLQAAGKGVAAGQFMRFLFTTTPAGVQAWDLVGPIDPRLIDTQRYCQLLDRAINALLEGCLPTPPVLAGWYGALPPERQLRLGQGQPPAAERH